MFNVIRGVAERWLRIPPEPQPPPGDEASARIFRAAPQYLKYLWFTWAAKSGIALLAAFAVLVISVTAMLTERRSSADDVFITFAVTMVPLVIITLSAIFSLALLNLNYEKRWYVVTDRSLRIREGVAVVREITFTFANIQNLSVMQGPIQRWLGIADLKVETAGGGGGGGHQGKKVGPDLHTAYFRGIDNATEVKELIQQRLRGFKDSGLGDQDDIQQVNPAEASPATLLELLREIRAEAGNLRGTLDKATASSTGIS